jgi:hypothetical protein
MFCKCKQELNELRKEMGRMESRQTDFLIKAHEIMKTVTENDKKRFVYDLYEEDVELIKEGKKLQAIRKIIE